MSSVLRVLMIEDNEEEALRVLDALREGGYELTRLRVDSPDALRAALRGAPWDLVTADSDVAGLGSTAALNLLHDTGLDIPFLVVSGEVSEEDAVRLMRAGAHDVILKQNLARLAPAVRRELRDAEARRDRRQAEDALRESEARFRRMVETASEGIWELGAGEKTVYVNQQMADMLGYTREEMVGRPLFDFMDESDLAYAKECIARRQPGSTHRDEFHYRRKDGGDLWALVGTQPVLDAQGRPVGALGMLTDITARKRIEEERKELLERERTAREAAEEASAAKDRFLALLSHELRNPLAPVLAGIPVLRHALPQDGPPARTLDIMERNVRVQSRLVTDLLDLTAMVGGQVVLRREPVRLDAVVRGAFGTHEEDAERAGLALDCHLEPDLWVCGDAGRLQRAVESLLSNAIRFTPAGGSVRVGVRECGAGSEGSGLRAGDPEVVEQALTGGEADAARGPGDEPAGKPTPEPPLGCIVVEDTGIGLDRAIVPRLFEMFQRGETGGWRRPGLGIGLALARSIVDGHGGRIRAESAGVGTGSRFTIELPLLTSGVVAADVRPTEAIRVLVVEEDADTRALLLDSLEMQGFAAAAAASGEAALELLRCDGRQETGGQGEPAVHGHTPVATPDVLLVDVALPGMDGYEFLGRARRLPGLAEVPAFAITGFGGEEDGQEPLERGYAGHFTKPVDVGTLAGRIRRCVLAGRPAARGIG